MSAAQELRRAARGLTTERTLRALAEVFAAWRTPGSPWLEALASKQETYSRAALVRGVQLGLAGWTESALVEWTRRELRTPAHGPELSVAIVAGSIPTNAFALVAAPLLAGSAVYARTPRVDPHTLPLFAAALAERDPQVGAALGVGRDDALLEHADAVIAEGRDDTLRVLRSRVAPGCIFVEHGHKLSLAAVGRAADLERSAEAVALDAALFDGRGCLSPAYVVVEDAPPGRARCFAERLAAALERLAVELPRGPLSAAEHWALRELRARWSAGAGGELRSAAQGTDWAVALLPSLSTDSAWPAPGMLRNLPLLPVADARALLDALAGLRPLLSSVCHAGWDLSVERLARAVLAAGGSRLCAPGHLQRPPIGWRHDGRGAIERLLRFVDVEPRVDARAHHAQDGTE